MGLSSLCVPQLKPRLQSFKTTSFDRNFQRMGYSSSCQIDAQLPVWLPRYRTERPWFLYSRIRARGEGRGHREGKGATALSRRYRSEERRVGKSVDLGGRRIIKKKKKR